MRNKLLCRKWIIILFGFFTVAVSAFSQNCDCESSFEWMKKIFEENDAGFQYVIDKKGMPEYEKHSAVFVEKVKTAKNNNECAEYLNGWLQFFRKGHIGIQVLKNDSTENPQKEIKTFPDWEKVNIDTLEFRKYLDEKKEIDCEGVWTDIGGNYTIGIKNIDNKIVGFIIKSNVKEWEPGQIKFRIYPDSAIYYMRDHSAVIVKRVRLASPVWFFLGNDDLEFFREYPKFEDKFVECVRYHTPYMKQLNSNTLYFQIPSFNYGPNSIDSIISANRKKILSTENLIIDLRYNGGGGDDSWQGLLPIIYTNPIRQKSVYYWSSEINNKQIKKNRSEDFYEKMNNNLGKFVLLFGDKYFTNRTDKINKYPKNIAVIVNEYCASSTEQFLLACKQSKKVKIFGRLTAGALDFSNLNRIESPCNDFKLYYATSKDVDIEDYPIDGIGIQPDFFLDDEIPEYRWVEYVNGILNNH